MNWERISLQPISCLLIHMSVLLKEIAILEKDSFGQEDEPPPAPTRQPTKRPTKRPTKKPSLRPTKPPTPAPKTKSKVTLDIHFDTDTEDVSFVVKIVPRLDSARIQWNYIHASK